MYETQNKEHYNLYYIFLEEKEKTTMSEDKAIKIKENAYHYAKSTYLYNVRQGDATSKDKSPQTE